MKVTVLVDLEVYDTLSERNRRDFLVALVEDARNKEMSK